MASIKFTSTEIERILDARLHSPIQDCVGDDWTIGSPLVMVAGTQYDFVCNANIRNEKVLPTHITNIWDGVLNKATFSEFDNTPMIVSTPSFIFSPTSANAGKMEISAYVNETVPLLLATTIVNFKGAPEEVTALITYYAGDDVGFDVKNKGVIFKITSDTAGSLYDPSMITYRT